MERKVKRTILLTLIAILCGQFNISFALSDFRISLAVIFILLAWFTMESFSLRPLILLTGAGIVALRLVTAALFSGTGAPALSGYLPELVFYLAYTVFLSLYLELVYPRLQNSRLAVYLPLILVDYLSNFLELVIRAGSGALTLRNQGGILLIAIVRTFIFWCLLQLFRHYRSLLLRQEHAERYKRLLIFISRLNEELVWLRKNTDLIETTMNTAYRLYERLNQSDTDRELRSMALDISRDVHEIKKEYLLILRGLAYVLETENEAGDAGMSLLDMLSLLRDSVGRLAADSHKHLHLQQNCTDNFYTTKPYLLLSVFRNLMINALEAAGGDTLTLRIDQRIVGDDYLFTVADDGPGIAPEALKNIFKPGFSTKINYETGEINRGLGLSLIKDMIEQDFRGEISAESSDRGATFLFTIKIDEV